MFFQELNTHPKVIKSKVIEKLIDKKIKKDETNLINFLNHNFENLNNIDVKEHPEFHLVLSGGGFKGYYSSGIAHIINKIGIIDKIKSIRGTSCGALNAVYIACEIDIYKSIHTYDLALSKIDNYSDLLECIYFVNDYILPPNAHEICNNKKVEIVTSKVSGLKIEKVIFNNFKSKSHLLDCLSASICIPFFINKKYPYAVKIDDDYYIDGGFVSNTPIKDTEDLQLIIYNCYVDYPIMHTLSITDPNIENIIFKGALDMVKFIKSQKKNKFKNKDIGKNNFKTINFHKKQNKENNFLIENFNNLKKNILTLNYEQVDNYDLLKKNIFNQRNIGIIIFISLSYLALKKKQ
jgi:hypothetical protein